MPRAGLTPQAVLNAALDVVDEDGASALTLAAVASRTGVAVPSLYKHVEGLPALRRKATVAVLDQFTARLTAAVLGHSGPGALDRFLRAYREYARENPGRYQLTVPAGDSADAADADVVAAGERAVAVILAMLGGAGITGEERHPRDPLPARRPCTASCCWRSPAASAAPEWTNTRADRLVDMLTAAIFGS